MDTDGSPQEITTLVGRQVYSNGGVYVGEVDDVRLDLDREAVTGLALSGLNDELFGDRIEEGQGAMVPYRWVRAVGDIVLVAEVIERLKTDDGDEPAVEEVRPEQE